MIGVPVAVLVNGETRGAAEALAAVMRETGAGLIFGGQTAGSAMMAQDFPLSTGQKLRIATITIELGDGTRLSRQGVRPDIEVAVDVEDEQAYFADPFKPAPRDSTAASTNRPPRRVRLNEAELVREKRDGPRTGPERPPRDRPNEGPLIHDPALARALDVLRGLAVVRRVQP